MNDRVAQCRKRCLNSSVFRIARRSKSSRFLLVTSFVRPLSSIRRGTVIMKLSSVTLTRTFVCWASVMANAKARLSASFTRRPNGKWKMTFRFPLTSRYPSRRTCRSVGRDELVRPPAEDEDVARAQVLDELLAQLAEGGASFREDVVRPFLRDRPDVRVVDHPGAFLLPDAAFFLVEPDLREDLDVRIAGGKVVEDREEVLLRQIVEAVRPPDELERLVDGPPFFEGHRDERLGEDIEGIARDVHPVDPGVVRGFR